MTLAPLTAYQKRLFAFLSVATFFEGYDFMALTQILPNLRASLGMNEAQLFTVRVWRQSERTPATDTPKPTPVLRSICGSNVTTRRSALPKPSSRVTVRAMSAGFARCMRAPLYPDWS